MLTFRHSRSRTHLDRASPYASDTRSFCDELRGALYLRHISSLLSEFVAGWLPVSGSPPALIPLDLELIRQEAVFQADLADAARQCVFEMLPQLSRNDLYLGVVKKAIPDDLPD